MYKRNVKGFRSVLGLLLAVCLLISGVPFEAMEAYAEEDGGGVESLLDNRYRIIKIGDGEHTLTVNDERS